MQKKGEVNVFKISAILVLLIITLISFLSIYHDLTTDKEINTNKQVISATGRAIVGLNVINTNEIKKGENK